MQLTSSELSKAVNSVNKEAYFLKNDKKVLVVDIPAGDLRFAIDLSRLSPFLLEYLCYYPNEDDRYKNVEFNLDKYGSYGFISESIFKDFDGYYDIQYLTEQSEPFLLWMEQSGSQEKLENLLYLDFMNIIMNGFYEYLSPTSSTTGLKAIFYVIRDAASKASGIDLSSIDPPAYHP